MRPWQIWSAFVGCLLIVVAAVGWLSFRARSRQCRGTGSAAGHGRRKLAARAVADGLVLAPLLAEESARPYYMYEPFYSVERVVGRALPGKADRAVTLPSPLLSELPPQVLLHFQIGPTQKFSSPRVLVGALRQRRGAWISERRRSENSCDAIGRGEAVASIRRNCWPLLPIGPPAAVGPLPPVFVASITNQNQGPNAAELPAGASRPAAALSDARDASPDCAAAVFIASIAQRIGRDAAASCRGNYEYQAALADSEQPE